MPEKKLQVFLKGEQLTIRTTEILKFPYCIEADSGGSSWIDYKKGEYFYRNVARGKQIDFRKLTAKEVRECIKGAEELRRV